MKKTLIELAGWYGTVAIVGAYALLSFHVIGADGLPYQLLNLSGALGIIAVALDKKDLQPAVLNIIWAVIGIVAVARILL